LSLDPEITSPKDKIGKYMLREAFRGTNLLPDSVLDRKKEAFSDGVSSKNNSWHTIIQDYLIKLGYISEEIAYKSYFTKFYGGHENVIPYKWMPKYCDTTDPSARNLEIYLKN
jgi:asparagine synthase (glutamine-hydrolysing)